jgi:hypothetical protein
LANIHGIKSRFPRSALGKHETQADALLWLGLLLNRPCGPFVTPKLVTVSVGKYIKSYLRRGATRVHTSEELCDGDSALTFRGLVKILIMKKSVIIFSLGFLTALIAVLPVHFSSSREVEKGARNSAAILVKVELMNKIRDMLGNDYRASDGYNVFFEVKADAVVVVERNGVKTLRIYDPAVRQL